MVDLNSQIDPSLGWELLLAVDINNIGQITGYGLRNGQTRAFLLTPDASPVPEPSSLAMWGIGALAMAFARRKSKQQSLAV